MGDGCQHGKASRLASSNEVAYERHGRDQCNKT